MSSLLDIAWLIPLAPFIGAFAIWLLLISFNRTMNRLSKPVSYFLITCVAVSTGLSFALFEKNLSGQLFDLDLNIASKTFHFGLYVDSLASITSTICSSIILVIMILSYYLLNRNKGYVLYFSCLGALCGSLLSFIFSGSLFHRLF